MSAPPQTPSWSYTQGTQTLQLWVGRPWSAGGSRTPDAVIVGPLADMLVTALSWLAAQSSAWIDQPDEPDDDEPPYPSDGQLGDWVRELRMLADRIEETRP